MAATDYELIVRCRNGDVRAWEQVLDRYERLVYSIPLNYGLPQDDAADIAQLTFTIFMQSLDSLREDSRLAGWLATVARRHTWRLVNRRKREMVDPEENLPDKPTFQATADETDDVERWETLEWINEGLSHLTDKCRSLLLALYFDPEQPSYEVVAATLGIAIGSIGPTRARCLEKLKQQLT
jgi:RNA polymerase sigma factor (sigma-70 family)